MRFAFEEMCHLVMKGKGDPTDSLPTLPSGPVPYSLRSSVILLDRPNDVGPGLLIAFLII